MINMRVQYLFMYKYLITCSYIWTAEIYYEFFYVIYAQIQPHIYRSIQFGHRNWLYVMKIYLWKGEGISDQLLKDEICNSDLAWYFCVYFSYKLCLVLIFLFPRRICCYRRSIITTILRSKYELICYLLALVLDR